MIGFTDWSKIEIKVGKVLAAEEVEDSNKLLKLKVDFGLKDAVVQLKNDKAEPISESKKEETMETQEPDRDIRQVISGIKKSYSPENIIGRKFIFITNLEPREIMGLKSKAMILAAQNEDGLPVLIMPDKEVLEGGIIG